MKLKFPLIIILTIALCFGSVLLCAQSEVDNEQKKRFILCRNVFNDQFYEVAITQAEAYLANYPQGDYIDEARIILGSLIFIATTMSRRCMSLRCY